MEENKNHHCISDAANNDNKYRKPKAEKFIKGEFSTIQLPFLMPHWHANVLWQSIPMCHLLDRIKIQAYGFFLEMYSISMKNKIENCQISFGLI